MLQKSNFLLKQRVFLWWYSLGILPIDFQIGKRRIIDSLRLRYHSGLEHSFICYGVVHEQEVLLLNLKEIFHLSFQTNNLKNYFWLFGLLINWYRMPFFYLCSYLNNLNRLGNLVYGSQYLELVLPFDGRFDRFWQI